MSIYKADLHIHTVLSPCAEVEMIPPFIVERAISNGLDMIAITDHNSTENVDAVIKAARGSSLKVIPGMECETVEGIHLVCLFDEPNAVILMQDLVYSRLPDMRNRPATFGEQFVVDETGEFIRRNERLLLIPTEISLDEAVAMVDRIGGLAIPAHVDRPSYGIYGVLGFLPETPIFRAVEISHHITETEAFLRYPDLSGKTLFRSSDAHRLDEIGSGYTLLDLKHRTVADIRDRIGIS